MADGVEWIFQLIDHVSGPASSMVININQVGKALKDTDDAAKKAAASSHGWNLDVGKAIGDWAMDLPAMAFEAGAALVAAGGSLVAAGLAFRAMSADAKRDTLFSMHTFLGAGEDAAAVMEQLEGFALHSSLGKDAFLATAQKFLGAGFSKEELAPLLAAVSDIQGANGGNEAAGAKLEALLLKARTQNKIDPRELMQLGNIGLSEDRVAAAIASQRHITIDAAYGVLRSGQMNGNEVSDAILGAVAGMNKNGVLGGIGEEFGKGSLRVGIAHLKDAFGDLFENVKNGGLLDFIHNLSDSLRGEGGQHFVAFLNDSFAKLSGYLAGITFADLTSGIDTFVGFLKGCWAVIEGVIGAVQGFGAGFMTVFDGIMPVVSSFWTLITGGADSGISGLDVLKTTFEVIGWVVGGVVGAVLLLAEGIIWVVAEITKLTMAQAEWMAGAVTGIINFFGNLPGALLVIGHNIVDGLWDGIKAGWAGMLSGFESLVGLLPAVVKKALGIASPSTVFAGFGLNTAEGFGMGLGRGDMPGMMEDAMRLPSAADATAPSLSGASGAGHTNYAPQIHLELHVTSSRDGEDLLEEVRRIILPELTGALEQLAIEAGVS